MSSVSSRYESPRDERQMFWLRGCTHWLLRSVAAAAAAIGMAVQELNCLAQAVAVASMAATETQRFGLNVVLRKFPEPRPRTYPVYDRLQQTVRYSQVSLTCRKHCTLHPIQLKRSRGESTPCYMAVLPCGCTAIGMVWSWFRSPRCTDTPESFQLAPKSQ